MANKRMRRIGTVVRDANDKTIVVAYTWSQRHRLYKRSRRRVTKFVAHDENNEASVGDRVEIEECRPYSATKRWRLIRIIAQVDVVTSTEAPEAVSETDVPLDDSADAATETEDDTESEASEAPSEEVDAEAEASEAPSDEVDAESEATEAPSDESDAEESPDESDAEESPDVAVKTEDETSAEVQVDDPPPAAPDVQEDKKP